MIPRYLSHSVVGFALICVAFNGYTKDSLFSEIKSAVASRAQNAPSSAQTDFAFSPDQGAEELVIKAISSAKHSIRLAAYSFTSVPVVKALINAKKRGVDVQCVLDKSNIKSKSGTSAANLLVNAGIATRTDSQHAIQHNKFIVIDGVHLQTGSFNYSAAAAHRNAENVIVIWNNSTLAKGYMMNWGNHWDHSDDYESSY